MKKKMAILFVTSIALVACNESRSVSCESSQQSTWAMRDSWDKALIASYWCQEEAGDINLVCLENNFPNIDCTAELNAEQQRCVYWWMRGINKIPLRECGATIFNIVSTPDSSDYHREPNMEDSDGDGISNHDEFQLGMNPCTEYSFGCDGGHDGSYDYDHDGIIDSEDPYPRCNTGEDPADYPSDCV